MQFLKYKIIVTAGLLFSLAVLSGSCKKETTASDLPDQLFRPIKFIASINGNIANISWVPIAGATYSLEVSKDSLLFTNGLSVIPLDNVVSYAIQDLLSYTRYSARIKAVSKDASIRNSDYQSITFVTGVENIFYTVASSDIGKNQILVKWLTPKSVSQLVVSTAGVADEIIPLSASDQSIGQKLVVNLTNNTSYTFKIYFGSILRGTVSVKTLL
jgi:hypothetical protein